MNTEILNELLKVESVEQSYYGKNGCMCGCNGDYSNHIENPRKVKNAIKRFADSISEGIESNHMKVYMIDGGTKIVLAYINYRDRLTALYINDKTSESLIEKYGASNIESMFV